MKTEEKVIVEFNLSNPEDLNAYKAFKNISNLFKAVIDFKLLLENKKDQSTIDVCCIDELIEGYIEIFNKNGLDILK